LTVHAKLAKNGERLQSLTAMHIQQTKDVSLKSGGPQYYLHDVPDHVKEFLRKRGAYRVLLQIPYGIASSSFTAVGRDHKLSKRGRIVAGGVGMTEFKAKNPSVRRFGIGTGSASEGISRESIWKPSFIARDISFSSRPL
jgi:hypothetical protein